MNWHCSAFVPVSAAIIVTAPSAVAQIDRDSTTPTPFVVGGVRLALPDLTLVEGPRRQGESVLTGTAVHTETGRLSEPMTLRAPLVNQRIEPGVIFHRVEFARQTPEGSRAESVWCGDTGLKTIVGARSPVLCLSPEDPQSRAFQMGSAPQWLSTSNITFGSAPLRFDQFEIAPSETDLLGEMAVALEIKALRRDRVVLQLTARLNDRSVRVLEVQRPIIDGAAQFPFWSHKLTLQINGDAAVATLSADGNGFGLGEIGQYTQP